MTITECLDRIDWSRMQVKNGQIVNDKNWHPLAVAFGGPMHCDLWAKASNVSHADILTILCAGILENNTAEVVPVRDEMLRRIEAARDWRLNPTPAEQAEAEGWIERYKDRRDHESTEIA